MCLERDFLLTELQHNKSYTAALEEALRKRDNADLKHDQAVHSVQTMVTEAADDGEENKESLQVCTCVVHVFHTWCTYIQHVYYRIVQNFDSGKSLTNLMNGE